mgnify:CR=1 FL=1
MRFVSIIIILIFCSCNAGNLDKHANNSNGFEQSQLTTKSIYGDWTIQEVIDSLYTDTITHRNYFDSNLVDTFYLNRIKNLAKKIEEDGNDSLTLFPETKFDKVIGKDAWVLRAGNTQATIYGLGIELNTKQAQRLIRLINNPLNFSWAECGTWTPSSRFDFYFEGKFVRSLDIGCSWQLKTDYEKVKFGTLKTVKDFRSLCTEIGLKNE